MADYIEVNIQTLEQDVKQMNEILQGMEKDMKEMFDTVTELDAMWDGAANEVFNRQFGTDRQIFGEMCDVVRGIVDSMENAKDAYRQCERNISSEIDSIRI